MKKKTIQKIAKDVVQFEINALKDLKKNFGETFFKLVKLILNNKNGKIITSGVGKSGIIARKWASTFSSTGTPSFFWMLLMQVMVIWVKLLQKMWLFL